MKRYLLIVMIFIMLFSFSACGNSNKQNDLHEAETGNTYYNAPVNHTSPLDMMDEGDSKAEAYEKAIAALDEYLTWGQFYLDENYEEVYEHDYAVQTLYNMFCELGDYRDAAEIVDRVIIHDNKLVSVKFEHVDNFGQIDYSYVENMEYNADGQLIRMESNDANYYVREFFYNEKGQLIEQLCYINRTKLSCKTVYSYDDRGSIIGIKEITDYAVEDNSWDVFYDDTGKITHSQACVYFDYYPMRLYCFYVSPQEYYNYSYNEQGQLISAIKNESFYLTCDYDGEGNLIKRVTKDGFIFNTREYKYDESGRLSEFIFIEGQNSIDYNRHSFVYGTSYSFNAEGLVLEP